MHWLARLKRRVFAPATASTPQQLSTLAAYATWAERYPPYPHNRLMEIEQETMLRLLPVLGGRSVLDLACGSGRYTRLAQQSGAQRAIGADFSVPMLRVGRAAGVDAPLLCASMTALPFAADAFDTIICALATGHLPQTQMETALHEMARVLRVGGTMLISDFHPALVAQGGRREFTAADGTRYAVEHYAHTLETYRAACQQAGLTIEQVEAPQEVVNGTLLPAVLAFRARKHSD